MTTIIGAFLRDEIIEDEIGAAYLEPGFLGVRRAAHEIEHRIFLRTLTITRRRVNDQRADAAESFGMV